MLMMMMMLMKWEGGGWRMNRWSTGDPLHGAVPAWSEGMGRTQCCSTGVYSQPNTYAVDALGS